MRSSSNTRSVPQPNARAISSAPIRNVTVDTPAAGALEAVTDRGEQPEAVGARLLDVGAQRLHLGQRLDHARDPELLGERGRALAQVLEARLPAHGLPGNRDPPRDAAPHRFLARPALGVELPGRLGPPGERLLALCLRFLAVRLARAHAFVE